VAQKSAVKDDPEAEDLYGVGCVANILQMLKLPDGTVKVLVEGAQRARLEAIESREEMFFAGARPVLADDGVNHEVEACGVR
jgi:ATP-dependent Lon protease